MAILEEWKNSLSVNQRFVSSWQRHPVHSVTLDNGLVLLLVENSTADIIATRIFIRFGSRHESREQAGLAHLLAAVLTKGSQQLSALEIAEQVESVGAGLSTDATSDYFLLSLKTVTSDFANLLTLSAQLLRSPSFPEAEVELERKLTLQIIRSQQEQPFTLAFNQLRFAMYQEHPYALAGVGTEAAVSQLCRDDLVRAHQTYFRPDNIVISLSGHITPETAITLIQQAFGDWQPPPEPLPKLQLPAIDIKPKRLVTVQETQQSIIMLGYLAAPVQCANGQKPGATHYAVLKLLSTYLGNGLSSRLFVELREKRGLAYEVSAFYPTRLDPSSFVVYLGTAPENTAIACEGLHQEVERLCTTPLTPDELQTAKNKLLGQYALGKQTNAQVAQVFGWYETLGLGVNFDIEFQRDIAAVTAELAQAVACQYLKTPYVSLAGPAPAVNSPVAPY